MVRKKIIHFKTPKLPLVGKIILKLKDIPLMYEFNFLALQS